MSLAVTYDELVARVAYKLHGTRDITELSLDESENIKSIVASGLRQFYIPHTVNPNWNHQWTFLKVQFQLELISGQDDYTMPEDFGGIIGDLYYNSEDQGFVPVYKTAVSRIQQYRGWNTTTSSYPKEFAEVSIAHHGEAPQRWRLMFWPVPDSAYTVNGIREVLPSMIDTTQKYPYGSMEHGETILMACLSAAEKQVDGEAGIMSQEFEKRLWASIMHDQRNHQPGSLGYNGDGDSGSTSPQQFRSNRYFEDFTKVNYLGAS